MIKRIILTAYLATSTAFGAAKVNTADIADSAVTNAKLANMANATFKCRTSSGTGAPEDCSASQVNTILGTTSPLSTKGDIYGYSTTNARCPVGSDTYILTADSTATCGFKWAAPVAGGVTSVAQTVPSWLSVAGSPITTTGTLAITATSGQTANQFLATPNGSTGAVGLRAIAGDDLPNPTSTKKGGIISDACIGNNFVTATTTGGDITCAQPSFSNLSGTATTAQMPAHVVYENVASAFTAKIVNSVSPVASTPALKLTGGVYVAGTGTTNTPSFLIDDGTSSAWSTSGTYFGIDATALFSGNLMDLQLNGTSKFSVSSAGVVTGSGSGLTSLNASNISSGTVPAARLPNPSSSTLGGVQSAASVSHQWINSISTSGVPALSQPAFSDVSGTATVAQTTIANQALTTCSTARTVDWSTSNSFTVTLTNANACAFTFSNQTSGQVITLDLYQPGTTGSATATWSSVLWAGGTAPTITTGASKHDKCTFQYNGTDTSGSCVQDLR